MFFDDWYGLLRIGVVGVFAYLSLVLLLRVSGSRTLANMNAYDWVVSVALGSTLASAITSASVSLTEGIAALALLVGLQFAVARAAVRYQPVEKLIKSGPSLLVYRGEFQRQRMREARVLEADVLQAVRSSGVASLDQVEAIVLETNGTFSIVPRPENQEASALRNVPQIPPASGMGGT